MYKYLLKAKQSKHIKLFLCDVDGTLTDAGMYYSENGDELKKFSTYDGKGFELLRQVGIKTGVLTSEKYSKSLLIVVNKLKIDFCLSRHQSSGKTSRCATALPAIAYYTRASSLHR